VNHVTPDARGGGVNAGLGDCAGHLPNAAR
jgi:hypothetical protein